MEGLWMVRRGEMFYLFGSGLVGYGVDDNFYLTAPNPLGPWTNRGYFAPVGTDTFDSQTFQGLTVTGPKGSAHVFIGHRWGRRTASGEWANATSVWLPLQFTLAGDVAELAWYDNWTLDTNGATIPP